MPENFPTSVMMSSSSIPVTSGLKAKFISTPGGVQKSCSAHTRKDHIHTFFYKNTVFKSTEPHILPTLKNILIAQNVSDLEMFLFCFEEAGKMKNLEIFPQKGDFCAVFG